MQPENGFKLMIIPSQIVICKHILCIFCISYVVLNEVFLTL